MNDTNIHVTLLNHVYAGLGDNINWSIMSTIYKTPNYGPYSNSMEMVTDGLKVHADEFVYIPDFHVFFQWHSVMDTLDSILPSFNQKKGGIHSHSLFRNPIHYWKYYTIYTRWFGWTYPNR